MADPVSWIGLGIAAVGALSKFNASKNQSKIDAQQAGQEQQLSQFNAQSIQQQADLNFALSNFNSSQLRARADLIGRVTAANIAQIKGAASADATNIRRLGRFVVSSQIASAGGSGVVVNEGTPLLVAQDAAAEVELDALLAIHGGEVDAWRASISGGLAQAELLDLASLTDFQGRLNLIGGTTQAQLAGIGGDVRFGLAGQQIDINRQGANTTLFTDIGSLFLARPRGRRVAPPTTSNRFNIAQGVV